MKKFYSLIFVAVFAMVGLKAQAAMYLVGDAFNGWNTSGNVVMSTDDNNIYYYTANLTAGKYFAFFKDTQDWGSQRGPQENDSAPTGDWEATKSGGAWKVATSGTYLIQYNHSTDQAKIALAEQAQFDPTKRKFAVTGAAFGNWNMPPSAAQTFTNNGDGTYTLVYEGATASQFKLSGVDINDEFDSGWSVFNGGCMYNGSLAVGDNSMVNNGNTGNLTFPVSGNVTLTISNVTESSCTLNIALTQEIVPDKAYYLIGAVNNWDESNMIPFVENDGVFTLTQTFSGEFKIKDENGNWLGGGVTLTSDNPSVTLADGGNLVLAEESEYTLTIENGVLTVSGFPVVEVTGVSLRGSYDTDWANVQTYEMQNVNGAWVLNNQEIEAGFEFKVVATYDNGNTSWFGAQADGDYWVTAQVLGTAINLGTTGDYKNLFFNEAGTFNFSVSGDLATLTVTGEFEPKVLSGIVKDEINRPIAEVKVTAIPQGVSVDGIMLLEEETGYSTTTDEDGKFSLEVPGGENYELTFEKRGYVSQTQPENAIGNIELEWDTATAITNVAASENVASVKYVNSTGMMSDTPFKGVNIMVVTYQDGSRKAVKLVK